MRDTIEIPTDLESLYTSYFEKLSAKQTRSLSLMYESSQGQDFLRWLDHACGHLLRLADLGDLSERTEAKMGIVAALLCMRHVEQSKPHDA